MINEKLEMRNIGFTILLSVLLYSCQSPAEHYPNWLAGEWKPLDNANFSGYVFAPDNRCEYRLGYFTFSDTTVVTPVFYRDGRLESPWECISRYAGNLTNYRIKNDSLKIFDLSKKDWINFQIEFNTSDTLYLTDSFGEKQGFVRNNASEESGSEEPFDCLVFYFPRTAYALPRYVYIDKSGEIDFTYTLKWTSEYVRGELYPDKLESIKDRFRQINIDVLEEQYPEPSVHPANAPVMIFVKDGKQRVLRDPVRRFAGREFAWAFYSAAFCDQSSDFDVTEHFGHNSPFEIYKDSLRNFGMD